MKLCFTVLLILFAGGCEHQSREKMLAKRVQNYFDAWNNHDFDHPHFTTFIQDTMRVWHNEKKGPGIISIHDVQSGWKQWDVAWNGRYVFDSVIINLTERTISGNFWETNDFNKAIGMPEGYHARVTYWLDEEDRAQEVLYDWDESNTSLKVVINPIVEWALVNDSIAISELYLSNGFVPSAQNAARWKMLLEKYSANQR